MEISQTYEPAGIDEIKILSNARLILSHDTNPLYSHDNLHVQFALSGDVSGGITCYLCLDGHELSISDKNYIYPLFVETMNILIGKQLSTDKQLGRMKVQLSPPKLSMISKVISTSHKTSIHKYELELDGFSFSVLTEYSIEALN